MVTTGGRGASSAGSSATSNRPSSTSDSATRLTRVAEFLGDELRGIGVDHVGDLHHLALLHQQADDVDAALGHAVGEFLDGDRLRDDHFADELFLRLVAGMALQALRAAAERGDRALAHFVGAQRGDERQAAALLSARSARRGRRCGGDDGTRGAAAAAARSRGPSSSSASSAGTRAPGRCCSGACVFAAEALLGFLFGLALGFFVVLVALVFLALARFGGFALGLSIASRLARRRGFFLGDLAFFGFAHARIAERMRARAALFLGQRAQHDAGWLRRGRGRLARCRRCRAQRLGGAPRLASRRAGAAPASASPAAPMTRRFTFSTTTCLLRPWLKLWRTTPVSVRGFSVSVFGRRSASCRQGSSFQLIPFLFLRAPCRASIVVRLARSPVRKRSGADNARETFACGPGKQGSMYHI